jgi:cell division protein FtsQ
VSENKSYRVDKAKIYWTIGIVVVGIIAVAAFMRKKRNEVNDIKVSINHLSDGENDFIKEKDIKEIIRRSFDDNVAEQRLGQLDVQRVEKVLEQDPFIKNAETYVDIAGNLNITITQREPICRIIDNNGLNYYLDRNGVKMPPSKYFSARVPIVTGALPPHIPDFLTKKNHGLKNIYTLLDYLNNDVFYKTFIQQIHMDASGELTLIPILGDQKLRIGTIDDLDDKMKRLKIFYEEAMPYEGWKKYNSISVKYRGQIVCKKR